MINNKMLIRPRNRADVLRDLRVVAQTDANEATIYLYDVLDSYYGIDPGEVVKAIAALDVDTIHLRMDGPGGDVFGARAICAAIRGTSAQVIAHVDGLSASALTFIAVNCDRVVMSPGAFFMIHQASTFTYGNADELIETANLLQKVDTTIVSDYCKKTGRDEVQILEWMKAATWFTADEALAAGFVDQIDEGAKKLTNRWDCSACANAPAALLVDEVTAVANKDPAAPEVIEPDIALDRNKVTRFADWLETTA